jgi:hypothetical protein
MRQLSASGHAPRVVERSLIRERTPGGLRAARARGRRGGRSVAVNDGIVTIAPRRERGASVTAIARHLGSGRSALLAAARAGLCYAAFLLCFAGFTSVYSLDLSVDPGVKRSKHR